MSRRALGRRSRAVVVLALAGSTLGPTGSVMAQAAPPAEVFVSRSLAVVADTYVSEVQPSRSAGSAPRLIVDGSPRRVTYLRFAVPPFQGLLRSATLRLHVADAAGAGSDHGGTVIGSSDSSWPEATTTWATRPPLDGPVAGGLGRAPRGQWIEQTVTGLVQTGEPLTLGIRSMSSDDVAYDAQGGGRGPRLVLEMDAPPNGTIISAVGDMVCGPRPSTTPTTCHQQQVSDMLVADPDLEAFLALGDLQYNTGALVDFQTFYEPSYGRVKDITHPVVGNHKYQTADAAGYWDYFGAAAGAEEEGWYSFDVGTSWHLVALNSNCSEVSCLSGSPQLQWLRADLQANDRPCVLAYWHHPRWSSGKAPGNNPSVDAFVRLLQRHRAEVILSGHSHNYERFGRQLPGGVAAAGGIRQFVVGTGGRSVGEDDGFENPAEANSQVRLSGVFGLLRMSLTDQAIWWSFVGEDGRVRDSGTDRCH